MKFLDEYRDAALARKFAREIHRITTRSWTIMEVCGGQTHAIVKFGIEDAGIVYAQELKRCWKCNTHLTRKASRVLSIGPECAEQVERGEEWRALDAHFNHENAED